MSDFAKLADDVSQACSALANWQPGDMVSALEIAPALPDLTRDIAYMWARLSQHARESGYLRAGIPDGIWQIAFFADSGAVEADSLMSKLPHGF